MKLMRLGFQFFSMTSFTIFLPLQAQMGSATTPAPPYGAPMTPASSVAAPPIAPSGNTANASPSVNAGVAGMNANAQPVMNATTGYGSNGQPGGGAFPMNTASGNGVNLPAPGNSASGATVAATSNGMIQTGTVIPQTVPVVGVANKTDSGTAAREFLNAHPDIALELEANPNAARDAAFMQRHPDYAQFAGVAPISVGDARSASTMGNAALTTGNALTAEEKLRLNSFLNQNPEVERQLAGHPQLLSDPGFIAQHPELKEFVPPQTGRADQKKMKEETANNRHN